MSQLAQILDEDISEELLRQRSFPIHPTLLRSPLNLLTACPHSSVFQVMSQLAEISDDDVIEELELLQATDLSAVEYMPAYLNKRLNNRLWSKRKQQQAAHR